jgi:pectinesterase
MKKFITLFVLAIGLCSFFPVMAEEDVPVYDLIVDKSGTGDYTTIQEAIDACVAGFTGGLTDRFKIFVRNGIYQEPVRFGSHSSGKTGMPISLIGESRDGVIIECDHYKNLIDNTYPDKQEGVDYYYGNAQSATMTINAEDFYGENFTIRNTKDTTTSVYTSGLYIAGRRQAYKNIKVEANRGALYIRNGRTVFIMDSYIEGSLDMTAANGTAVIYNTTFKSKGYGGMPYAYPEDNIYFDIPAINDTLRYGHIFRKCTFEALDTTTAGSLYLAMPMARESGAMFLNCKLGAHINPLGIKANSNVGANLSSWFYEYKNTGADGVTPVDISQRATNCKQLSDTYFETYINNNNIYGKFYKSADVPARPIYYFDPLQLCAPAGIPQNVEKIGSELSWDNVTDAEGYIIYLDGAYIGMTRSNTFIASETGEYTVCSVGKYGAMSKPSGTATQESYADLIAALNNNISNAVVSPKTVAFSLVVKDKIIYFDNETDCQVYDLYGRCLINKATQKELSLQSMQKGVYLVKTTDAIFGSRLSKIVI